MTIWILALLLLGCLAGIGYNQGAIRVAASFIGIIVSALLAGPMGKLFKPIVSGLGATNPVLLWLLPPIIAFWVLLILFKVGGFALNRKVDLHFKYKAGDLRLALWERINSRLGLCLGLLNALAYLVLISMVIYPLSYWTVQLATPDAEAKGATDSKLVKLFNQMGRDLQRTGMARVARAIDPMPDIWYDAADVGGLLFQNPLLEARLSRYPAFLALAERQEFQTIAQDATFTQARLERTPVAEILKNGNVQAIIQNPDTLMNIWGIVSPDLTDLTKFLETGKSEKYSDPILGRWFFDAKGAMSAYIRANPNIASSQMMKMRAQLGAAYSKMTLVAFPTGELSLKNYPHFKPGPPHQPNQPAHPPTVEFKNFQGKWKEQGGEYELSLGAVGERKGKVENGRLTFTGEPPLAFVAED